MSNKMDRPFLVGEKIYLRPFDLDDIDGEYIQWLNDEEMVCFIDTLKRPTTFNQAKEYVEKILNSDNYIFFAVIDKSSGKHIGNVKIGPIDWINRISNYGRLLSKDHWGKGYGTEVLNLIIKYSFETLNLNKLWDSAISSNKASIKSVKKAGMIIEGEISEYAFVNGKYESITLYGITQKEYFKMKNDNN